MATLIDRLKMKIEEGSQHAFYGCLIELSLIDHLILLSVPLSTVN